MTEAEQARMNELEDIAKRLQFWARRYAEGRMTYVSEVVNKLTQRLIFLNVPCTPEKVGEHEGTIWAKDGDARCCTANHFSELYGDDGTKKTIV